MKFSKCAIPLLIASAFPGILLSSCEDEVSTIGSSIFNGEVSISVDSLVLKIDARTVAADNVDARSTTNLLGQIDVPEYGRLSAEYITQLLSAAGMTIPDSIGVEKVDSLKLLLEMPRNMTLGDTLAPQQLKIYRLNRQLPENILSNFDPSGYYDSEDCLSTGNYTLSAIALGDSAFLKDKNITVGTLLPRQWAVETFNAYRAGNEIFQWPQTFNAAFPGLFIKPSFGRGAMANVTNTRIFLYYHYLTQKNVVENSVAVTKVIVNRDSVCLFANAPEVIGSSIIKYTPSERITSMISEGKKIITAPVGYRVRFKFPADQILSQYWANEHNLSVINNLTFAIPATTISNEYGLVPPASLLMIRTSEIDDFFANGRIPDHKTSFSGTYSYSAGRYEFSSMREYIVDIMKKGSSLTPEELDFTLIPVDYITENSSNPYDGSTTVYVTGCNPSLKTPGMAVLDTDKAVFVFTFTSQLMK